MRDDVAALYVDARGPYPALVSDWWCADRNAWNYAGPLPVVAHPPCGQWGRLKGMAHENLRELVCAVLAVHQVRRWGGVLEHPAASSLWDHEGLPKPGALPDEHGGWTIEIDQCRLGHAARKNTWLYVVGASREDLPAIPPAPACVSKTVENMSHQERRRTPAPMAEWLIELASRCRVRSRTESALMEEAD